MKECFRTNKTLEKGKRSRIMIRLITKAKREALDEGGFSLVEMIVAMVILVILLAGLMLFLETGLTSSSIMRVRASLNQESANVMEKMARQIRVAYRFMVPTVITPMEGNPIYFTGDVRGDGTDRNIWFYRTNGSVLFLRDESTSPPDAEVARNVTTLVFTYYDSNDASLGTQITNGIRTSIKRVDIQLVMQRQAGTRSVRIEKRSTVLIPSQLTSQLTGSLRRPRLGEKSRC